MAADPNYNGTAFEEFCGGRFWDLNVTWYTNHPDFTPCFQRTIVSWVAPAFLWFMLPFYSAYLCQLTGYTSIKANRLNVSKTLLSLLLAVLSLADLAKALYDEYSNDEDQAQVMFVTPSIQMATYILVAILIRAERNRGFITSGVLFLFWTLSLIAGIVPFHSLIFQHRQSEDLYRFVLFFISYAVIVIQTVMSCLVEELPYEPDVQFGKKQCPEVQASFLSRITFNWLNRLCVLGYRKALEEKDLWSLNPRDLTRTTYPGFSRAWREELQSCNWYRDQDEKKKQLAKTFVSNGSHSQLLAETSQTHEKTPLLGGSKATKGGDTFKQPPQVEVESGKKKKEPSLGWVLAKVFGLTLFQAHCCKLVCDLLTFVGPMLQSYLIDFTEDKDAEMWKGYMFAALFFVSAVVNSFFFHQLFHIGMTLGMRVKASVIAAVYEKALTMSNDARKTSTVGEIVNLMSVDAQRLQDVTGYLWMVWSSPLQIALAMWLLWGILGPSVLAGLGVMVLLIPINGYLATLQRNLQIKFMTTKDARIKLMNEVLNGMKVLKLYAWEASFEEKVAEIRNKELNILKKYSYLGAVGTFTWTCAPFIVTLATFVTYVLLGNQLDSNKAFTSLSLFNILRFPINMLPMMVSYLVTVVIASFMTFVLSGNQLTAHKAFVSLSLFNILRFPMNVLPQITVYLVNANVSVKRLGKFLQTGDLDDDNVQHNPSSADPITIQNGTFSWGVGKDDMPVLKNISMSIPDGKLVAVVGQVGAGKSSIISALLGEMEKLKGYVNVRGSVAYVAQQAWIQNATLRDNILFSKEMDNTKYENILEACAMKPDLEILPGGDMVEIGEKGINLSGGQKQRVSLARAVYQNTDIYLLDDPLSAVDSHVGKHIFDKVVGKNGVLKDKTRLLVTHGVQWLPKVDQIVVIVNGEISEVGSYEELLSHDGAFAQFLKTYLTQEDSDDEDEEDEEIQKLKSEILHRLDSIAPSDKAESLSEVKSTSNKSGSTKGSHKGRRRTRRQTATSGKTHSITKQLSRMKSKLGEEDKPAAIKPKTGEKLIEEEKSQTGGVKLAVFLDYCRALGMWNAIWLLVFFLMFQAASVASNVWLSVWTDDPDINNNTILNTSFYVNKRDMYLGVYGGLGAVQAFFVLVYAIIAAISMVVAAGILHHGMLTNILRSPMAFYDTTPIGRILNRFSRDIETIDTVLPQLIRSFMNTVFSVLSTIVVISYSTPIFLSVVVPLGILYYFIQRFYIPTSRQLKRIESTSRSPIYVNFSETVTGASTIRAFGAQTRFRDHSEDLVDHNLVYYFASIASNRWLGFRLEVVGALVVVAAALFAVLGRDTLQGGIVGLSISYALQVTSSLNWMVRMTTDLETNIVSVERVKEYSETPTEAAWYVEDTKPSSSWPGTGRVILQDYTTRYRPELDLVLRGISVDVKGGEKVGIVGRTGAGKSSLTLALFRIIEASGGRITVDGLDISGLGLHQLRRKLTILPQDPVLFSGDLRMNLDPFDKYTDDELWTAIEHAHLKDFVSQLPAGLTYEVGEGGQNLSVGQRQLVCLARTLLHKTRILILDEATAAVDLETDELIQKTIRVEFAECTILTIAHRLNTIMDNDRVIVLADGLVKEFDSPGNLLQDKKSMFFAMAKDAGLTS